MVTVAMAGKMASGVRAKPAMSQISRPKKVVLKLAISATVAAGMMDASMDAPLWMAWIRAVCMVEVLVVTRPIASQAALIEALSTPKM